PCQSRALSLHDALPIFREDAVSAGAGGDQTEQADAVTDRDGRLLDTRGADGAGPVGHVQRRVAEGSPGVERDAVDEDAAAERLRSEEHTSELQSRENLV